MQRNKSLDSLDLSKSIINIDSLVDYLDLGMFEEYQVLIKVKRGVLNYDYVVHNFIFQNDFEDFVRENDNLIVYHIASVFNGDNCAMRLYVK